MTLLPIEIIDEIAKYLPVGKMLKISKWAINYIFKIDPEKFNIQKLIDDNDYEVIEWLKKENFYVFNYNHLDYAISSGNIVMCDYFLNNYTVFSYKQMSIMAARKGHLNIIKYIVLDIKNNEKYFSSFTIDTSIIHDKIDIFVFLIEQPYNRSLNRSIREYFDLAISHGSINILRYFKSNYDYIGGVSQKSLLNLIKNRPSPVVLRFICREFNPYISPRIKHSSYNKPAIFKILNSFSN